MLREMFHPECGDAELREAAKGLARALGGPDMPEGHLAAVLQRVLGLEKPALMSAMIEDLAQALGQDGALVAAHRDAMLRGILGSDASPERRWWMIRALGRALGGPGMTDGHRDAMLRGIIGSAATSTPEQVSQMIRALGGVLRGPSMIPADLDGMLGSILGAHETSLPQQMGAMINGLALALGGPAMVESTRIALVMRIGSHATSSPAQTEAMMRALDDAVGQ
jgi:hypothetical protein